MKTRREAIKAFFATAVGSAIASVPQTVTPLAAAVNADEKEAADAHEKWKAEHGDNFGSGYCS